VEAQRRENKIATTKAKDTRIVDEQLGQKKNIQLSDTQGIPSTPNFGIVNIYPQEYTPLTVIPGNSTYSSQILSFDGAIMAIGDYYYDDRTKSIEKRLNKRKRGDFAKLRSSIGRFVEWKVGLDPK
jgi:hypothetical protein